MKKQFIKSAGFILLSCVVLLLVSACVDLDKITITNPDLSKIQNGTYQGNSTVGPVKVILDVTVVNGTISSIEIVKHRNGRGKSAEAIVPRIIEKQSLEVDVITGATASSKAILKAAEDALN